MIKLNNKNITYVALADSNNSTIGVKEIWYADTNNSVKLVYRRKLNQSLRYVDSLESG